MPANPQLVAMIMAHAEAQAALDARMDELAVTFKQEVIDPFIQQFPGLAMALDSDGDVRVTFNGQFLAYNWDNDLSVDEITTLLEGDAERAAEFIALWSGIVQPVINYRPRIGRVRNMGARMLV